MKIGILGGTGKQGSALAKRWAKAGYSIIIGSRDAKKGESKAAELNRELGLDLISGGDNSMACTAEVIVLTIPFENITNLLSPLLPQFKEKIVMDLTVNLIPGKFFKIGRAEGGPSSYEFLREYLKHSSVVGCMKTISSSVLDSDEDLNQVDFQMGTDNNALDVSFQLSREIGLEPVRVKGKFHAYTIERMVALAIQINQEYKGSHVGFSLSNLIK